MHAPAGAARMHLRVRPRPPLEPRLDLGSVEPGIGHHDEGTRVLADVDQDAVRRAPLAGRGRHAASGGMLS
jgi:hypothetical protein